MEQWCDVINPGRQGTMGEHFRVGVPESIGHPSDESKDIVFMRAIVQLATLVDVKLPAFDTMRRVTSGACTNSAPLLLLRVVVATLDAMPKPVKVLFPVAATPTCLVASNPKFTTGLNRKHKAARYLRLKRSMQPTDPSLERRPGRANGWATTILCVKIPTISSKVPRCEVLRGLARSGSLPRASLTTPSIDHPSWAGWRS